MSIAPGRGEVVLQPNYFTSSVYVSALRDDISSLILQYHEAHSQDESGKPFSLFKAIWLNSGWNWLHFKVFDSRSRQTFLEVTIRLFLERTVKTEAPFTRVVGLFGMYVFYYTQVEDTAPALHYIKNIAICRDHYLSLMTMADSLTGANVLGLRTHVQYVLSCLNKDKVFFILPQSELGGMNPRELPREIYAEEGGKEMQKRKGRPARREKGKKARIAIEGLEEWMSETEEGCSEMDEALALYQGSKRLMKEDAGVAESVEAVGSAVAERLTEYGGRVSSAFDLV